MANTITPSSPTPISIGLKEVVVYITLQSDGTNETATVIYDSSAVAATLGEADPLNSNILRVDCSSNAASTARVRLLWDASTDVVALDIPSATDPSVRDFTRFGGLPNQGGSGKTGDILLTTTGLASGDTVTLVLTIKRA